MFLLSDKGYISQICKYIVITKCSFFRGYAENNTVDKLQLLRLFNLYNVTSFIKDSFNCLFIIHYSFYPELQCIESGPLNSGQRLLFRDAPWATAEALLRGPQFQSGSTRRSGTVSHPPQIEVQRHFSGMPQGPRQGTACHY